MDAPQTFLTVFLERAFTMPTTVWSVLLLLVTGYWLLRIFAGLDFDGVEDAVDGLDALDAVDAVDGVDHALEGGLDHMLDGGVDHVLDGADHALDGGDHALDGHDFGSGPRHHGLFGWLGFHDVPKTFSLTLVALFGWTVSFFGIGWLIDAGKWAAAGLGAVLILGMASLAAAIGLTAVSLIPMRRLLVLRVGAERIDLLGETCVVKTGRVDERFGQAETRGGHLVQVRARDGRAYRHGDAVVIFDYDRNQEVFYIAPLDASLVDHAVGHRGVPARSSE